MRSTPAALFREKARTAAADAPLHALLETGLDKYRAQREKSRGAYRDYPAAREAAADVKWDALLRLDDHLEAFASRLEARGARVHWAGTAARAREVILEILRERHVRSIVKSKAMTAEEIGLSEAIEKAGMEVVESDLGEFIVQLRREAPYHIVFPAMHLTRSEIGALFTRELQAEPTESPEELTMIARRVLRRKYLEADAGITGANFAIAETGMISITENEGNARLGAALPRTLITLVGIEKILPRLEDLALFLPLLANAGTGQALACYNTLYSGPRQPGEPDGPDEHHVVLLDNGRTTLLADPEKRDALRCIRCGACLNVCPVFRTVGGHAYGTTYSGPIGSVITPVLRGLGEWKHLSAASSLCGACTATCPVGIDLHHHLLRNRRDGMRAAGNRAERKAYAAFARVVRDPRLYRWSVRAARALQPLQRPLRRLGLDPTRPWTASRDLPRIAPRTFREWWRRRR
jgi:L-lactate dehydrogenase complex protein LldF